MGEEDEDKAEAEKKEKGNTNNDSNNNDTTNPSIINSIPKKKNHQSKRRCFHHLTAIAENDNRNKNNSCNSDVQRNALFSWGAEQIISKRRLQSPSQSQSQSQLQLQRQTRRTKNNQYQDQNNHHHLTKDNIVNAVRRVTLNSFTVKGLIEAELKFVLDDDNDVSESDHKKKKKNEEEEDDDDDEDHKELCYQDSLTRSMMQIGKEDERGIGLYILASATNHSCAPNTFVTFDNHHNHEIITFRAIKSIKVHEEITISYGPTVIGTDSDERNDVQQRRKELFESHCFHCRCAPCIAEEKEEEESKVETELEPTTRTGSSSSTPYELEAMEFIENVIVGGYCTASDALQKSKNAPDNIVQTHIFRKAMIDTSILQASIALDVELALGFQQLALQSIELRCRQFRFGCHPYHDDHDDDDNHDDDDDNYHNIEIAYEI